MVQIRGFFDKSESSAFHGSGFAVDDGRRIVTNYHVVAQAVLYPRQYRLEYLASDGRSGTPARTRHRRPQRPRHRRGRRPRTAGPAASQRDSRTGGARLVDRFSAEPRPDHHRRCRERPGREQHRAAHPLHRRDQRRHVGRARAGHEGPRVRSQRLRGHRPAARRLRRAGQAHSGAAGACEGAAGRDAERATAAPARDGPGARLRGRGPGSPAGHGRYAERSRIHAADADLAARRMQHGRRAEPARARAGGNRQLLHTVPRQGVCRPQRGRAVHAAPDRAVDGIASPAVRTAGEPSRRVPAPLAAHRRTSRRSPAATRWFRWTASMRESRPACASTGCSPVSTTTT